MVVSLLVLQGFLGYYHHYRYEKDKPAERRWITYLHIVGGLILVFLGLLNCGSGLTMARVPSCLCYCRVGIVWYSRSPLHCCRCYSKLVETKKGPAARTTEYIVNTFVVKRWLWFYGQQFVIFETSFPYHMNFLQFPC
jgi:hypothetical protein